MCFVCVFFGSGGFWICLVLLCLLSDLVRVLEFVFFVGFLCFMNDLCVCVCVFVLLCLEFDFFLFLWGRFLMDLNVLWQTDGF